MMIRKKPPKLISVIPDWITNGIFVALNALDVPWKNEGIAGNLDLEFFGNYAGEKRVSPLIQKFLQINESDTLTQSQITTLAQIIFTMNNPNWLRLWNTMSFEYDPIENYNMREQMTDDTKVTEYGRTLTRTNNLIHGKTGTETDQPNITETQTPNVTTETQAGIYGFNSSESSPANDGNTHTTGTNTTQRTGTDTTQYNTQETDTGTQTDANTGEDTETRNYILTRTGNIGVMTTQDMITKERELWVWNYFYNIVFPAVSKVLTIKIY